MQIIQFVLRSWKAFTSTTVCSHDGKIFGATSVGKKSDRKLIRAALAGTPHGCASKSSLSKHADLLHPACYSSALQPEICRTQALPLTSSIGKFCQLSRCSMSTAVGAAKHATLSGTSLARILSSTYASTSTCGNYVQRLQERIADAAQKACCSTLPQEAVDSPLLMGRGDIRTKRGKVCLHQDILFPNRFYFTDFHRVTHAKHLQPPVGLSLACALCRSSGEPLGR